MMKRFLFKLVAKSANTLYSRFPIFGELRASFAVLRKDGMILVIERNDDRGFSFPGGISNFREAAEQTLRREVQEETGLVVQEAHLWFQYRPTADIPCLVSVFEAEASGTLAASWEGTPIWLPVAEAEPRVLASQLEVIRRISGSESPS